MKMKKLATTIAFLASVGAIGSTPAATITELFFSEYIEGSSNNKALEIYNGTGAAINLATGGYNVQVYFNGGTSAGLTINLTGTVASSDVYVLAQSSANATILAQADQTNGAGWFNGDDAIVLRKGTTIIDSIGQIGVDPGSEWGTGLTSTADNTLRRLSTILAGDTNGSDAFEPSFQWQGFATDSFDGLGSHSTSLPSADPIINEFSASTTGTDVEFIEILGTQTIDYSRYWLLELEGDGAGAGVIDEVIQVGTTDANGFWLASLPANSLENGSITLLLVEAFVGALGNDLDTNNDGILDATPWARIVDSIAVYDGDIGDLVYSPVSLGPNFDGISSFAPGGASRIPDGANNWVRNDFDLAGIPGYTGTAVAGEALNTPGASNRLAVSVPEPATLVLFGLGLAGIGAVRRRRIAS